MKTINIRYTLFAQSLLFILALFASSCENDSLQEPLTYAGTARAAKTNKDAKVITHYGPAQPIGGGVIRTLTEVNTAGEVLAVGIMISERALYNLPHHPEIWTLSLPKQAAQTPFDHLSFDWNPHGHDPDDVFGHPHFDLHAYTISMEERMKIGPGDPQLTEDLAYVAQFMPQDYHPDPTLFTVPMMGMHWIDFTGPEFGQEDFTHNFIIGSYHREVVFFEPMFTL